MKKLLFIILLGSIVLPLQSQSSGPVFQLEKNAKMLELVDLGNEGYITRFGDDMWFGKGARNHIMFFGPSGELIWEKKLDINIGNRDRTIAGPGRNTIISNSNGSFVYFIEWDNGSGDDKIYCTQITKSGDTKTFDFVLNEKYGKGVLNIFSDDQYLYFVTTENGNETDSKRRYDERIAINRFSHTDQKHTKVFASLPALNEFMGFWTCIGNREGDLIFASKEFVAGVNMHKINLVSIDQEGKEKTKVLLDSKLNQVFMRPSKEESINNDKFRHRGVYTQNLDFYFQTSLSGSSFVWESSSFGFIMMDDRSKDLYVYGLFGPKEYPKRLIRYTGFYIFKYDLSGNLIWKLEQNATGTLADNKYFEVHGLDMEREMEFQLLSDNSILLRISTIKAEYFPYLISSEGKFISSSPTQHAIDVINAPETLKQAYHKYYKAKIVGFDVCNDKGWLMLVANRKQNTFHIESYNK